MTIWLAMRPKVCFIEKEQPNAFATGCNPENAAVTVHRGVDVHPQASVARTCQKPRYAYDNRYSGYRCSDLHVGKFRAVLWGNRNNPLGIVGVLLIMIPASIAAMLVQMAISQTHER